MLTAFDEPVVIADARLHLGGSLGIALGPLHATSGGDLMRAADVAMYAAKSGAGGIQVFSPEMLELNTLALTLGGDLRDALARGEIGIVVQPVLVLATDDVHSVEVLARWHHPIHGEVPPELFFAAAEQAALVQALSERILELALTQARRWLEAGTAVRVAVNVAPRWLSTESLPPLVGAALARYGVPADLLCLELTERGVIADPQRVTQTLERLRSLGVHLSVDDFGTGYSSLTYLSRLPVDQVKIHKSFVQGIVSGRRDLAIVRSLVDLGRHLGLEVVAEGVTSEAMRSMLEEMGCPLGQGYLFTAPFEAAELDLFVTGRRVSAPVYEIGPGGA
jgi:EAL domain-containing protein (putative c-di-GMP-specific phosphodiesterase class I)